MEIIKIKSPLPITEYAAHWDISLGRAVWNEPEKVDKIRNWLLDNEKAIIEKYTPFNDGGTGLGYDSVTSRFGRYNVFDFVDECPELKDLLTFFRKSWIEFVTKDHTSHLELYFVCWFNVIRDGQAIREHAHGCEPDGYLSGNMHLDNYNTFTYYRTPYNPFTNIPFPNVKGGFTMFPGYVPHKTDEYHGTEPRVSIAFDLRIPSSVLPDGTLRALPFMNHQIFNEITRDDQ